MVEYLGRYTHKAAITKHRVTAITDQDVVIDYKDCQDGTQQKSLALPIGEFLRRFEQHFLPGRFVKIRHFGFLQNHGKATRLNAVRATMDLHPLPQKEIVPVAVRMLEKFGKDITIFPKCERGKLVLTAIVYPSALKINKRRPADENAPQRPPPQNKGHPDDSEKG